MIKPTIHLNGTYGPDLQEQLLSAIHALNTAITKLEDAAPHGRDYYPQGPDAINQATREHIGRIKAIIDVRDELAELSDHVWHETLEAK